MISPNLLEGLERYVEHGLRPGSFLEAVLCNDLAEALGRADAFNRANIYDIVQHIYNEIPSRAWGSQDKVNAWIAQGGRRQGLKAV